MAVTYDAATVSAAEILAPGINKNQPQLMARALRQGMRTAATRDAIMEVTGGRTSLRMGELGGVLRAAAAVVKARRSRAAATADAAPGPRDINSVTCADINRMNAEFYRSR